MKKEMLLILFLIFSFVVAKTKRDPSTMVAQERMIMKASQLAAQRHTRLVPTELMEVAKMIDNGEKAVNISPKEKVAKAAIQAQRILSDRVK